MFFEPDFAIDVPLYLLQSTPDNSNLQRKPVKKVRFSGSSEQMIENKKEKKGVYHFFLFTQCHYILSFFLL